MSQARKLGHLFNGLRPTMDKRIWMTRPKTYEEFPTAARLLSDVCGRGDGLRKLGSKPIGGGKREAAKSASSSNEEARGSGSNANTTTASIQTRGPCRRPGESPVPAGMGSRRRDAASSTVTFVGGFICFMLIFSRFLVIKIETSKSFWDIAGDVCYNL
jgi:hypothetical protein